MSKFSLNNLGKALSEKSGLNQMEAELFIRKMFDVCNQGLDQDKQVKMKWLGTFKIQAVKDRESIDVNTGERIVIEGRDKITFTPDNILKEIVNKPFAQFETVVVNDGVDFDAIDKKFEEETKEEEEIVASTEVAITTEEETAAVSPTSEVIDFLDTATPSETNADVIIIGETQPEEPVKVVEEPKQEEPVKTVKEPEQEEPKPAVVEEETEEETPQDEHRHLLIPRYLVVAASIIIIFLIGGIGWFAFNYGKMAAQRDQLAMQLNQYRQAAPTKPVAPAKPVPKTQPSQEEQLRKKASEDSARMAKASEAVKAAEQIEKVAPTKETSATKTAAPSIDTQTQKRAETDARVRTGAYRITGVAEIITIKAGQSIESISKRYLGPGMECYVEALNGTTSVKEGQKIKIPKLELKKKK